MTKPTEEMKLRRQIKAMRYAARLGLQMLDKHTGRKWTPDLPAVRLALVVMLTPPKRKRLTSS